MKGNFSFGKRLLSTALAAAMAATAMGTQAFAQPEATEESAEVQPSRVVSWSWPEEAGLDWSEEDQAWLLSCVCSEEQPLTEETLTQLLPGQITAVVQAPSVSQPESTPVAPAQEEPAVVDTDTVEDLTVVEENISTFETAANPDTVESDQGGEISDSAEDLVEGLSEELGESTSGNVEAASQTLSLDLSWDFSGLSFPVQPGQYSIQASLPEGYLLDANASPLSLTLAVLPGNDLNADTGLCVHHSQHTAECGYVAGVHACKFAEEGCPYCVVSWTWVDDQGFLVEMDGSWGMGMPGVSQDNPLTRDALSELLPTQITATTGSGESLTLALTWDLSAIPEEGATGGDYSVSAALSDTQYALTEEAAPLTITLQLGGAETYDLTLPSGDPNSSQNIVNGVSPNGTTIDLFDYWITGQTASDNSNGEGYAFLSQGINKDHALIFGNGLKDYKDNNQTIGTQYFGDWNVWTGSSDVRKGIVSNNLVGGYPQLNLGESIRRDQARQLEGRNGNESLAYLFDPTIKINGKESYEDVQGLLQVDKDGYYYYSSKDNYAVYYQSTNSFSLYKYPGVLPGGQSPVGQFFPFNEANENESYKHFGGNASSPEGYYTVMNDKESTDSSINHYFGIHMTTRFVQQNNGYTDSTYSTPVTYEFAGDDDVWIYIDGVLVADLGGNHNAASVNIDFATGEIRINGQPQGKLLGSYFSSGNTLTNDTYHTLDFFYLERGNVDSNMRLKYNLITIPESSLIKVDQMGDPVPDAEFTLYSASDYEKNQENATAIATGTTDSEGEFVFLRPAEGNNQYPITVDELYNTYGNQKDSDGNNLILVETFTPDGYRTVGEIGLYFDPSPRKNSEVLLLSNSIWDKGAYAMPKVTATTPNKIHLIRSDSSTMEPPSGGYITLVGDNAVENPLMFAVVFQKNENGDWCPVYGDPLNGWTVLDDYSWDNVLKAATEDPYIFQVASSGAYQVEVSNLPGDIKTYYHITGDEKTAKYTIGYYYTTATTLDQATGENTWRIDSDPTTTVDADYALERVFSVDLYVTNIKNRLLVQKVDDQGAAVNGAVFDLYKSDDVTVDVDGKVSIKNGVSPYDSLTTKNTQGILKVDGGGIFPNTKKTLPNGEYYLFESQAPEGYLKNEQPVHIVVDNTGVYADAGTIGDGIVVLRGVGSLMRSMLQFAVDDKVDTTLNAVQADLATNVQYSGESFSWGDASWQNPLHLKFSNENAMLDYSREDGTASTLDNLTLATDEGWSKLLIRQCYKHDDSVDTSTKTNLLDVNKTGDVTNLFAGSVVVRVTNERVGNLKISKTVTGDSAPTGKEFEFTVTVRDGNAALTGEYDTKNQKGEESKIKFADGTATVKLHDKESLTILNLPADATYTVEEVKIPSGFAASVKVENDSDAKITDAKAEGTIQHNTTVEAAYTNEFDNKARIALIGTKTITGGAIAPGQTFKFKLEAVNDNAKKVLPNAVEAVVTGDGTGETKTFSFDQLTFAQTGTYVFKITEVTPASVTSESPVADGVWYDMHTATVTVTVTKDPTTSILTASAVYSNSGASSSSDAAAEDKAAFTNAYESLKISKTVTGDLGDKTKPFTFTLALTQNGNSITNKTYPVSELAGTTSIRFDGEGKATIELKDGQSAIINNLPVGAVCTVTETEVSGYTMEVSVNGVSSSNGAQVTVAKDRTQTVAFTNNCTIQPPTGLHGETRPYKAMVGLAGAAAVLGIAGWVAMRRRKRREQE